MLERIKSLLRTQAAGPPQTLRAFSASDPIINQDAVSLDDEAWLVTSPGAEAVRLFEVENPDIEDCVLTYRGNMKTDGLSGRAYLEMWCRFPGRGEFFSKGLHHAVRGTNDWASYETPFYLKKGQRPDLVKLNVMIEGQGKVWLKDIELLVTPLKAK